LRGPKVSSGQVGVFCVMLGLRKQRGKKNIWCSWWAEQIEPESAVHPYSHAYQPPM